MCYIFITPSLPQRTTQLKRNNLSSNSSSTNNESIENEDYEHEQLQQARKTKEYADNERLALAKFMGWYKHRGNTYRDFRKNGLVVSYGRRRRARRRGG